MSHLENLLFCLVVSALSPGASAALVPPANDFTQAETDEAFPAGSATHTKRVNRDAFSQASANMSFEREIDFKVGNGFFKRVWVTAPASTQAPMGWGRSTTPGPVNAAISRTVAAIRPTAPTTTRSPCFCA
jgi:CxxC motif-containing protein (DUF1111 family)